MNVRRPSSDKFTIEEKPYKVGGFLLLMCLAFLIGFLKSLWAEDYATLLMALVCLVTCGALGYGLIQWSWIEFDRAERRVELRRIGIGFRDQRSFPLDELQEVIVETEDDSQRLALRFEGEPEPIPLTTYFIGGRSSLDCARSANDWLRETKYKASSGS